MALLGAGAVLRRTAPPCTTCIPLSIPQPFSTVSRVVSQSGGACHGGIHVTPWNKIGAGQQCLGRGRRQVQRVSAGVQRERGGWRLVAQQSKTRVARAREGTRLARPAGVHAGWFICCLKSARLLQGEGRAGGSRRAGRGGRRLAAARGRGLHGGGVLGALGLLGQRALRAADDVIPAATGGERARRRSVPLEGQAAGGHAPAGTPSSPHTSAAARPHRPCLLLPFFPLLASPPHR